MMNNYCLFCDKQIWSEGFEGDNIPLCHSCFTPKNLATWERIEEEEMLSKFYSLYGESLYVDPMEQEIPVEAINA
jgi:hypothetical protein